MVVEDVDRCAGLADAEAALFHLHNLTLANGMALLLTGATPPARWGMALPDLASRMQATAITTIEPPDDALLSAVLIKLFADRQLTVAPTLIPYLVARMERSFAGAQDLVAALDQAALSQGRAITLPLAALVLDKLSKVGA